MPGPDFVTGIASLRYDTSRRRDEPGKMPRWQIVRPGDGYTRGLRVVEDDVPVDRALAMAHTLGSGNAAVIAMCNERDRLRQAARDRMAALEKHTRDEQYAAVEERRCAALISRQLDRLAADA